MKNIEIKDSKTFKILKSENYNYIFNKKDGLFMRWGKTEDDDPEYGLIEIADIEISTICSGVDGVPCPFCYKANTPNGINMSFETYKQIFDKLPKSLTQCALGGSANAISNPDIWKIMEYTRENGVIPNITVANISDETAEQLAKYCGAVAVSRYEDKNYCYDSIKKLTDRGMKQINIHVLVSEETYPWIMEIFKDTKTDPRLAGLNAIVLLSLKQRGRGVGYHKLSEEKFAEVIRYAMDNGIKFGADSCSAGKIMKALKNHKNIKNIEKSVEPCESQIFSGYIDVKGVMYPCSFSPNLEDGINLLTINDFNKEVWFSDIVLKWRNKLLKNKRNCPIFDV